MQRSPLIIRLSTSTRRSPTPHGLVVFALVAALALASFGAAAVASAQPEGPMHPAPQHLALAAPSVGKRFGVAVAGAEFGDTRLPGDPGRDYLYPADVDRQRYFGALGLTLVRAPFRWERIQPLPFGPLRGEDVAGVRAMLDAAEAANQQVILDLHNYGWYYGRPLAQADTAAFADLWRRVAREFRGHPALYGYELMNEPHDLPEGGAGWAALAQSAADAIRSEDANTWILVPGYGWQTAATWPEHNGALDVQDPTGRLLYAAHEYFDADHSGSYRGSYDAEGAYPSIGADRLQPFVAWLSHRDARGIVTEYGVPDDDPRWLEVLDRFLAAVAAEPRLDGGTYWAAGPWWGTYRLAVEPGSGPPRPQTKILARYPSR